MSTIIECPACSTRYKMNKPIPEGGRSVKCARCGHQWRLVSEQPETLSDALDVDADASADGSAVSEQHPATAEAEPREGEESAAALEGLGSSDWEVRRGNLAAAIAAMGHTAAAEADEGGAEVDEGDLAQQTPQWASPQGGFQRYAGESKPAGEAGFTWPAETDGQSAAQDRASHAADPAAWQTQNAWMRESAVADPEPREVDPETSIREAIKAAMDDQESGGDHEAQSLGGGGLSIPRPVFAGPSVGETIEEAAAQHQSAGDQAHADPADASDALAEGTLMPAEQEADPAIPAEAADGPARFESDIAGIFRQQMQSKRRFGLRAAKKGAGDGHAEHDLESETASEQAEDRYMADSPLDADAAALQLALEGSLRERHGSESRSSGGGLALAAAWAVFLSVLSGVTLAFVNFRDEIVTALPGTAALYRGVGFSVQDREIDFGPVTYRWTITEGKPMIEVTGQIINLTDREIAVPRVLVNVHDADSNDAVKATATVRSEPLPAHETADFTLEFLSPPKTITQIELAFAETEQ